MFALLMLATFTPIAKEVRNSELVYYSLTLTLLYIGFGFLFYFAISKLDLKNNKIAYVALGAVVTWAILLRWIAMHFLQTQPISDFNQPNLFYEYYKNHGPYTEKVDWSQRDTFQLYYSRFPAWFPYMRLVMLIYNITGLNFHAIQVLNMLLIAGTIIFLYLSAQAVLSRQTALMAGMLFATNPSLIMYSGITTPDHVTIFLIVLVIFFWTKMEKFRNEWPQKNKRLIIYSAAVIISCVLVNYFKPLSIFFIVVFLCYEFTVHFFPALRERYTIKKLWEKVLSFELAFLAFLLAAIIGSNFILTKWVESTFKTDVINSTGLYLLWAYSVDENDNYDSNVATNIFLELTEKYNNNYEKVFPEIDKLAVEQFKNNLPILPKILAQKFYLVFGSEYGYFGFSNTSVNKEYSQSIVKTLQTPIMAASLVHMRILYLLSAIYAIYAIFNKNIDKQILLAAIIIFGFSLVLLLGGVQSRYKSLIVPEWCLISAYMCYLFYNAVQNRFYFRKNVE